MEGPPLGPGGEDVTWPDQVALRGRKASSTRKIKPQTSNLFLVIRGGTPGGTMGRLSTTECIYLPTYLRSPNVRGMIAALPLRGRVGPTRTMNWWTF